MAYKVNDLSNYDLVILNNGMEFKTPPGACHTGSATEMFYYLFPEHKTLDEFEQLFANKENTKKITITDRNKQNIYGIYQGYQYIKTFGKEYEGAYHEGYDEQGNYYRMTTDLIKIVMRRAEPGDLIEKMQSDMEYMAIMTDIDIDDNEE